MLVDRHRLYVSLLLSEVARPRPLTTFESAWVSRVLGALPDADQHETELRMTDAGPVLLGSGGFEVRLDGASTVVLLGGTVHRFRDADAAVLMLLTHPRLQRV